jgi:CO/xanthine dehydrogenase FAD-binding subunit
MARFALSRPGSVQEALDVLAADPEGSLPLAGGQSLMILLRQGLVSPRVVVSLDRAAELGRLEPDGGHVRLGSMVTYARLARSPVVVDACPLLARAAGSVGSVHIRNAGTVGGSLAHADPAGDVPTALLVLDARVETSRCGGGESRAFGVGELMTGAFETVLDPGELVVAVEVDPTPLGATVGYRRYHLRAGEYPLAVAACVLEWDADRTCRRARVALGGAHPCPRRLPEVEATLEGTDAGPDVRGAVRELVTSRAAAMGDVRGSAEWRATTAASVLDKALADAAAPAAAA